MKLRLPAKSVNESVSRAVISAFIAELDPTVEELGDIRCAVSEAVTNCIVHAYRDTVGDMMVVVNSDVLSRFKNEDAKLLMELERQCAGRLIFRSDPSIHREAFAILDPANNNKTLYQVNM